ncbi:MAG: M48 family metalloprotease [Phycisphaeraceae bacterium]|nr:M48 family metalloprotease [Phycisphaeraceae bacterium]MCW5754882.1 M48 family metalloprotease [Phycisphaeraceae bacterium]
MVTFTNNLKTVLLLGLLTGLLVAVGGMMGREFILPMLVIATLLNFGIFFFSDKLAISAMRGRELDAASGGDLHRMLVQLSERAGLPRPPRLYLSPHKAPNAFATGRSPSHAAVCFTQGAIDLLDPHELEGVMAHELAHIKNRDTLISTIAATVAGVLAMLAQWAFFLSPRGSDRVNPFISIIVVMIAAFGAALIKAAISRSREFVADAHGARIAGSPHGLISALRKLEAYSRRIPLVQPNPAQNNLFIVEPFAGKTITDLFATHPPTEQRIASLLRAA